MELLKIEELMWFLCSRTKWLTYGGRSMKYYHMKTIHSRRFSKIIMLKNNLWEWIEESGQLKGMVHDYYKELFQINNKWSVWNQFDITFPRIDIADLQRLNDQVSDEEVRTAVFSMKPWKSPGPDGFHARFYLKSLSIVVMKVCDYVKNVWLIPSKIDKENQIDVCMILKVSQPHLVSQFW